MSLYFQRIGLRCKSVFYKKKEVKKNKKKIW